LKNFVSLWYGRKSLENQIKMTMTSLPSPHEVKTLFPLVPQTAAFIEEARETAKRIIHGKDPRKALIIGPCSIHDRKSAVEYAKRFKELAEAVGRTSFMVMRVYVEKSRTSTGWKGLVYDPHLDGSHDIKTGLLWTRELLLTLAEMRIPTATEFVDPLTSLYFEDLITWGFIGARTSSSQTHRQFASARSMPIGFKNSTDGHLENAIYGALSATTPHASMHIDSHGKLCAIQSEGNAYSHIVLRGACGFTNYDPSSVRMALDMLKKFRLQERLMIDCSHGNCQKQFDKQHEVFLSVLGQIEKGNDKIFGLMLESHLKNGNQPLTDDPSLLKYAVSITDPCLDWKTTEELIYSANLVFSSACAGVS
jgi:3-deoxy-7-phosphoheptulonate synthase